MKIEFHNAHGNQLVVTATPKEAARLISDLAKALQHVLLTDLSHYTSIETMFENDNDRWEPTTLDILVEGDLNKTEIYGCKSVKGIF